MFLKNRRIIGNLTLVLVIILGADSGCCAEDMKLIPLPSPRHEGSVSLEEAVYKRRSVRSFKDKALKLTEVSQLLWAAGGKTIDGLTGASRSAPSAGGLYPLEIYLVAGRVDGLQAGIYKYIWRDHNFRLLKRGDYRAALAGATLIQSFIAQAPVSVVFTAVYEKTAWKYGDRGIARYVPMDAGHAAQNLFLQAVAIGLGTVIIGAFYDRSVKELLDLEEEDPLSILINFEHSSTNNAQLRYFSELRKRK